MSFGALAVALLSHIAAGCSTGAPPPDPKTAATGLQDHETKPATQPQTDLSWLSQYDITWDSQSRDASESMPCGGHDIGINVWVEDGDVLFYLQRSGSLAETNEYLKLGRVRLRLTPNPFAQVDGAVFSQTLRLRDGSVEITGSTPSAPDLSRHSTALRGSVRLWTDPSSSAATTSVVHVDIDASETIAVEATFECWRNTAEAVADGNPRRACFTLQDYPGTVTRSPDTVAHQNGGVLFFHRNPDDKILPDLLIDQQALQDHRDSIHDDLAGRTFGGLLTGPGFEAAGVHEGSYQGTPFRGWRLSSQPPEPAGQGQNSHRLQVVTHIDQTETLQAWRSGLARRVLAARDANAANTRARSRAWWDAFWTRSWIVIHPQASGVPDDRWRAARNYNLFRYQLGCNAYGEYPTRFNGGNFTFDAKLVGGKGKGLGADWRDWGGGVFTAQNQRLVYWPMLKSGDFDMMRPQFELYRKALPGSQARVKEHFGHDGAVFSEYVSTSGLALGAGYGWATGGRTRGQEVTLGSAIADGARGYREAVEPGVMANPAIAYHWCSQLEHAYMMLERLRFDPGGDGDAEIEPYLEFIEDAVIFFDEHYRMRQRLRSGDELDDNGKLVIYPSTACESYRGATNPTDVVSGLLACVDSILRLDADQLHRRDHDDYRSLRKRLPDLSFGETEGKRVILPAASFLRSQRDEAPHFYPLFPFNRFDLIHDDLDVAEVFRDTWRLGTFFRGVIASWHQDGIFLARMGMTQEAAAYNLRKLADSPRRFPTFWGPGHDWVPDHNHGGSGMLGLQEMLMQTPREKILLLPAWPATWDVDFRLHAPQDTVVTAKVRSGKITELDVTPAERMQDVVLPAAFR